jgi:two-component system phosphate regulon sensor histidine kinase PhoR
MWTLQASVADDAPLQTATTEARRTLGVAVFATLALASALVLAARAARAETQVTNMRSDFAAAVTHELKTPIATIQLVSERLASSRNTSIERSREYANLALQESRRLRRLIDNLLAYNKITEVTDAYAFELLEIRALLEESLKEFAFQLSDKSFEVAVDISPDLPLVLADPTAMRLMLSNVIDNAIRYSPETRSIRIRAGLAGRFVSIDVSDCGIGISPKDLALVTKRFYRIPHSESGGSGLGLFIARRIAADHHGTLTVQSSLGVGTTVTLTIPAGGDT